jgi:hypothetical protein
MITVYRYKLEVELAQLQANLPPAIWPTLIVGAVAPIVTVEITIDDSAKSQLDVIMNSLGWIEVPTITSITPALGDVNGAIPFLLNGTGFVNVLSVTIGGLPATGLDTISSTQVSGFTPALAAGVYNVVITTSSGSFTLVAAFESWYPTQIVGAHVYDSTLGVTGNPITQWDDQGAGANDLTAAGAARPTLVASRFGDGTRPAILFDGVANDLRLVLFVSFGARTTFAAVKWAATSWTGIATGEIVTGTFLGIGGDAGGHDFALDNSFGLVTLRSLDADAAVNYRSPNDATLSYGSPRVVGITHDGAAAGPLMFWYRNVQQGATQFDPFLLARASWVSVGNGGVGNPFNGEIGAVVQTESIVTAGDRSKLAIWMYGKFCARDLTFDQIAINPWIARDGAGLLELNGNLYMLGGWNNSAPPPFGGGTSRVTNEVWRSIDQGVTWVLILAEQLSPPPAIRWSPRHTAGWVTHNDGYMYVIGSDVFNGPGSDPILGGGIGTSDVYRSLDGITWEMRTLTAPWGPRVLHMVASFQGALWVLGGQTNGLDPLSAVNDVWRSIDGGANWSLVTAAAPWSARGLANSGQGLPTFNNLLWLMGGGTYAATFLNDVWSFDGTTWTLVTAAATWSGRQYNSFLAWDGRLWAIGGVGAGPVNFKDVWISTNGITWLEKTISPWRTSHADGIVALSDRIIKGPGNGDVGQPADPGNGSVWSITRNSW